MAPHKILLTGASGLLGRSVFDEFEKHPESWEILGLAFSRAKGKLRKVDIGNKDEVRNVMQDFKPEIVVHSAAERKVDIIEKDRVHSRRLNIEATQNILEEAKAIGAWVLFISTDYVFDGKTRPTAEDAPTNPLNTYGELKVEGEKLALDGNNGVLRFPALYGPIEYVKESPVTILFEKLLDTAPCNISDYEIRYPTSSCDVAVAIRQLCEKRIEDPSKINGIYHWSCNEPMTKYAMTVVMAEVFNLPHGHITGVKECVPGAPRPYHSFLSCARLEELGVTQRTSFKGGIKSCISPFLKSCL